MASGVLVDQSCIEAFKTLHSRKYKYIIYKISEDEKSIQVEKTSADAAYEDFIASLPETEPRWAVYDFDYEKEGEGLRSKICFYAWTPDESLVRLKMLYASSKSALRLPLDGVLVDIQGTDFSEVEYESVLANVTSRFS